MNLTGRLLDRRGVGIIEPKRPRAIAEFLVVGISTVAFAFTIVGIIVSVLGSDAAGRRDFAEYWASGYQLAHHANPYDGTAILGLERSIGSSPTVPVLIMWNPPSALLLVLPLGFLGPQTANLLWSVLLLVCLVVSVQMVRIMHGRPKNQLHLLGYSFAPALVCLMAGQVSLFMLLGLVLFLYLHRSRPFLAGVSLWLCLLKPHLFLPVGVVLLVWAVTTRSYKLLAGVVVSLGFSIGIAVLWDPLVWSHYVQMMSASTAQLQQEPIPCLSIILRWTISRKTMWLQYVPSILCCIWALAYYRKHRDRWDWIEHGGLLTLVSVLFAPYTWFVDQAILIPALLHGVYLARSQGLIAIFALASAVIEIEALRGPQLTHSVLYLWTAPAWFAWYLYTTKSSYATLGAAKA
jgi:hypothetical protein